MNSKQIAENFRRKYVLNESTNLQKFDDMRKRGKEIQKEIEKLRNEYSALETKYNTEVTKSTKSLYDDVVAAANKVVGNKATVKQVGNRIRVAFTKDNYLPYGSAGGELIKKIHSELGEQSVIKGDGQTYGGRGNDEVVTVYFTLTKSYIQKMQNIPSFGTK